MRREDCGPRGADDPAAPPLFDAAFHVERFGDDPALLEQLLEHYARELPALVETIRDAVERGDLERSAAAAHTLKGISATVGAAAVARDALHLLEAGRQEDLTAMRRLCGRLASDAAATTDALRGVEEPEDCRSARPEGGS